MSPSYDILGQLVISQTYKPIFLFPVFSQSSFTNTEQRFIDINIKYSEPLHDMYMLP